MGKIETAVNWAVSIANDNSHGYSQSSRWGPDYDCSSLVIQAWENAGVPVKSRGATYTGNMRGVFVACGFADVTTQVGLSSGYGLQSGDVLLNYSSHTAMYIGNGRVVHARSSEGNSITGDQSGNEVRTQNYWNFPWDCVLRYKGNNQSAKTGNSTSGSASGTTSNDSGTIRKGMKGGDVKDLQTKLIALGYSCGGCGADGDFGNATMAAVMQFQKDHNLTPTGEANLKTQSAIKSAKVTTPQSQSTVIIPVNETKPTGSSKTKLQELGRGDNSLDTLVLQAILKKRGYDCGNPDGDFGPKTEGSLNHYKQENGMTADGKVDTTTWKKLLAFEF